MRRFLTKVVVEFGGCDPRFACHLGAENKKAARRIAVRAQSSLPVTSYV